MTELKLAWEILGLWIRGNFQRISRTELQCPGTKVKPTVFTRLDWNYCNICCETYLLILYYYALIKISDFT